MQLCPIFLFTRTIRQTDGDKQTGRQKNTVSHPPFGILYEGNITIGISTSNNNPICEVAKKDQSSWKLCFYEPVHHHHHMLNQSGVFYGMPRYQNLCLRPLWCRLLQKRWKWKQTRTIIIVSYILGTTLHSTTPLTYMLPSNIKGHIHCFKSDIWKDADLHVSGILSKI